MGWALYILLKDAPVDERGKAAARALRTVAEEPKPGSDRIISTDCRLWVYLSLRLLESAPKNPGLTEAALLVRRAIQDYKRRKPLYYIKETAQLLEMIRRYVEPPAR